MVFPLLSLEDVNMVTVNEPMRITPDMVKSALADYDKELAEKTKKRQDALDKAKIADPYIDVWDRVDADRLSHEIQLEVNDALNKEVADSYSPDFTLKDIEKKLHPDHYRGQLSILSRTKSRHVTCLDSHRYRFFVEYDDKYHGYYVYYDNVVLNSIPITGESLAGLLTQLLSVLAMNSIDNTIAMEESPEVALKQISIATANFIGTLDEDFKREDPVDRALEDHKLFEYLHDVVDVPSDYLPVNIIDEVENRVYKEHLYGVSDAEDDFDTVNGYNSMDYPDADMYPTEEDVEKDINKCLDKFRKERIDREIMESDADFHGFTDPDSMVWHKDCGRLIKDDDYLYWGNEAIGKDGLPMNPNDLSVEIRIFARTLSDSLLFELEPYKADIGNNYEDFISPAALYVLLVGSKELAVYNYTPLFRVGKSYTMYRTNLGKVILGLIGKNNPPSDTWDEAMITDILHIIHVAIDNAMWAGTAESFQF